MTNPLSIAAHSNRRAVVPSCMATIFCVTLQACGAPSVPAPALPSANAVSTQTLTDSLIYATREFCVPYVVDGAAETSLIQRPGVSERHYDVHGKDVIRYVLDRPGLPEVSLSQRNYCSVTLANVQLSDQPAIVAAFTRDLRFDGRATSQPHGVERAWLFREHIISAISCVHGKSDALITISNPQYYREYGIEINVKSDRALIGSCIADRPGAMSLHQ